MSIIVVGTIGKPGSEASAKIDVLEQGFRTDVGKVIKDELEEVQIGYREDMVKYKNQIKRISNGKSSK